MSPIIPFTLKSVLDRGGIHCNPGPTPNRVAAHLVPESEKLDRRCAVVTRNGMLSPVSSKISWRSLNRAPNENSNSVGVPGPMTKEAERGYCE